MLKRRIRDKYLSKPIIFFLIFALFLLMCKDKKGEPASYIQIGKSLLSSGSYKKANGDSRGAVRDFNGAIENFSKALNLDKNNKEAKFGYALSLLMMLTVRVEQFLDDTLGLALSLLSGQSQFPLATSLLTAPIFKPLQSYITLNDFLSSTFEANYLDIAKKIESKLDEVRNDESWNFYVDKITWAVKLQNFTWKIDLSGEYDATDANFILSVIKLTEGILQFIMTVDIHITLKNVTQLVTFVNEIGGMNAIMKNPTDNVLKIISFLMNTTDNLFGLEQKFGEQRWKEKSKDALRKAFQCLADMYDTILKETDDQSDDVISLASIKKEEAGGQVLEIKFPSSSTIFAGKEEGETTTPGKVSIELPRNIRTVIGNMIDGMDGKKRVSWAKDVAPTLSVIVVILLKSGALDSLVESFLQNATPQQRNQFEQFLQPGVVSVNIINSIISAIIPDVIELDLNYFFSNPVGVRRLLPAWNKDNELAVEWECVENSVRINPYSYFVFCKIPPTSICFYKSDNICEFRRTECTTAGICTNYCGTGKSECREGEFSDNICVKSVGDTCREFCYNLEVKYNLEVTTLKVEYNREVTTTTVKTTRDCFESVKIEDSPHFLRFGSDNVGRGSLPIAEIPPDRIVTTFPYIGFQIANLNIIWLSGEYIKSRGGDSICGTKEPSYVKPNLCEMNIFIQSIAEQVKGILGAFLY